MNMVSTNKLTGRLAAAMMFTISVLPAAPALAASDAEQAETLIREGVQLRAQDKAARALPLFEKAYQISRSPRTAAQLGLCELELGYYIEAERYLNEALATPDHPWIAKNKTTLKRQLEAARGNIGELALTLSPSNAEVLVNNKLVAMPSPGAPIRLDKGLADVEVRSPGFASARETITIVGGKREQRTFVLVPESPSPVAIAPPPAAPVPGPESGAPMISATSTPAPASNWNAPRIAAWATAGVAVGALVFGTVEAFNASSKQDAFNNHTGLVNGVPSQDCGTANLSPGCKPLKDAYDSAFTLSIVGFATAGALAIASSVLFVLTGPDHGGTGEPGPASHAFVCAPDLGAHGLGCSLRF